MYKIFSTRLKVSLLLTGLFCLSIKAQDTPDVVIDVTANEEIVVPVTPEVIQEPTLIKSSRFFLQNTSAIFATTLLPINYHDGFFDVNNIPDDLKNVGPSAALLSLLLALPEVVNGTKEVFCDQNSTFWDKTFSMMNTTGHACLIGGLGVILSGTTASHAPITAISLLAGGTLFKVGKTVFMIGKKGFFETFKKDIFNQNRSHQDIIVSQFILKGFVLPTGFCSMAFGGYLDSGTVSFVGTVMTSIGGLGNITDWLKAGQKIFQSCFRKKPQIPKIQEHHCPAQKESPQNEIDLELGEALGRVD
jgi:hypothetical protein